MQDIFISYVSTDRPWADWIAWVLEEKGYTLTAQVLDGPSGESLVNNMKQALTEDGFIVIVLSPNYITFADTQPDWHLSSDQDPTQVASQVIPIRVEDCQLPSDWGLSGYVDVVDTLEAEAEKAITAALPADSLENPSALKVPAAVGQAKAGTVAGDTQPPVTWPEDYAYREQLKLRYRTETVQGYTEPLTDGLGIEIIKIPTGTFLMGSPEDEPGRLDREGPQHEVSVPSFFMGKYPITQAAWRWVAENLPQVNRELQANPSNFEGDRHPVERVSWYDAVEFCDRLSLHTGRPYRLPSEAEWEYACRANTATPFHFGETIATTLANYRGTDWKEMKWSGSYGRGPKGEYRKTTTPVGRFGVTNGFGLGDMHGNALEWCQDHYHDSYEGAPMNGSAWIDENAEENASRVLRGGSWDDSPSYCRSASRNNLFFPRESFDLIGFRLACSMPRAL